MTQRVWRNTSWRGAGIGLHRRGAGMGRSPGISERMMKAYISAVGTSRGPGMGLRWRGAGVGRSRRWRGAGVVGSRRWRGAGVGGVSARALRPSA